MNKEVAKEKKKYLEGKIYSDTFCAKSNNCRDLVASNNGDKEIILVFNDNCKQTNKIIDNKGSSAHEDLVKISELLKKIGERE